MKNIEQIKARITSERDIGAVDYDNKSGGFHNWGPDYTPKFRSPDKPQEKGPEQEQGKDVNWKPPEKPPIEEITSERPVDHENESGGFHNWGPDYTPKFRSPDKPQEKGPEQEQDKDENGKPPEKPPIIDNRADSSNSSDPDLGDKKNPSFAQNKSKAKSRGQAKDKDMVSTRPRKLPIDKITSTGRRPVRAV